MFDVTDQPLLIEPLVSVVTRSSSGAVAIFLGVVRDQTRGRQVLYLEYEAYREMAIPKMREIADEIRRKWKVDEIAMVHRIGHLEIGEASVAIARIATRPWQPAPTPSTASKRPCRSGRKRFGPMAKSGSARAPANTNDS